MTRLALVLLVAGSVVIALPDDDNRLFSISRLHGPSLVDAIGAAAALVGWALLLRVLWRDRARIRASRGFVAGAVVFAVGAAVLVVGVLLDLGWWWLVGAALMAGVQAAALGVAGRAANSP